MKVNFSDLITPIDWENCKVKYPIVAAELVEAFTSRPMPAGDRTETRRKLADAPFKEIEVVIKFLNQLPEDVCADINHWATVGFDHDKLDTNGASDFRTALASLYRSIELQAEFRNYSHPKNRIILIRAHEICKALAHLFALDRGTHPTRGNSGDGTGANGEFLKILAKVLYEAHEDVSDTVTASEKYLKELKKASIFELRAIQTISNENRGLFWLSALKTLEGA